MLCGCRHDRWPIMCLVANEVFLECEVGLLLVWPIYHTRCVQQYLCGSLTLRKNNIMQHE